MSKVEFREADELVSALQNDVEGIILSCGEMVGERRGLGCLRALVGLHMIGIDFISFLMWRKLSWKMGE